MPSTRVGTRLSAVHEGIDAPATCFSAPYPSSGLWPTRVHVHIKNPLTKAWIVRSLSPVGPRLIPHAGPGFAASELIAG